MTIAQRRLTAGKNLHQSEDLHALKLRLHQQELQRIHWMERNRAAWEGF